MKKSYLESLWVNLSFPDHRGIPGHQGGSLPRDAAGSSDGDSASSEIKIDVSKIAPTGKTIIPKLKNGVRTRTDEAGPTGHGFRWMSRKEIEKFIAGDLKYGGVAKHDYDPAKFFANTPGDFFLAGGSKEKFLIEVNVQGIGSGLDAPENSVGLNNVVGAWRYNPKTGTLENIIK